MKNMLIMLMLIAASCGMAAPAEIWLTKERAEQLKRITSRPYIAKRTGIADGKQELVWRNGAREWVTTQDVRRVIGLPAANGWQSKLDAKDTEKQALLDDLNAVKGKPTKKGLEDIINKHDKPKPLPAR